MNWVLGRDVLCIANHKRHASHNTNTNKNIINRFYSIILHYILANYVNSKFNINLFLFLFLSLILLLLFFICARIDTYLWIFYYYLLWGRQFKCEKYCTRTNGCTRSYFAILFLLLFLFFSQNSHSHLMYMQFLNQFNKNIQMALILLILYSNMNGYLFISGVYQLVVHLSYNMVLILISLLLILFFAQKYNLKIMDKYKQTFPISAGIFIALHFNTSTVGN